MKTADDKALMNAAISNIVIMSGIRPAGRTTDNRRMGRFRNGILYLWSGEGKFWVDGKRVLTATDGDLVFIPKGLKYKMQYTKENSTFVVVNFDICDQNGEDIRLFDRITTVGRDDETRRIASVMAKLEMSSASQGAVAGFRRKELLYRLLTRIFEENFPLITEQERYPQIFKGALLLKQNYLENIPIERFASVCNISVSSFRELFRKQYGMSPLKYRNYLRINRARELLSESNCTVTEAAFASGFENVGYFCNCYKKQTGETPSQTRTKSGGI